VDREWYAKTKILSTFIFSYSLFIADFVFSRQEGTKSSFLEGIFSFKIGQFGCQKIQNLRMIHDLKEYLRKIAQKK
jgi:hypothetical protein